jgi:hypothetical protein
MPAIYGMIGEADPKKAPRFRLKVNGRWIDIQLAEALLIHEILESWLQPATEAIKMGLNAAESPGVAVRDLVARKHKNVLEVDFDGGIPTPPPPRILQ